MSLKMMIHATLKFSQKIKTVKLKKTPESFKTLIPKKLLDLKMIYSKENNPANDSSMSMLKKAQILNT